MRSVFALILLVAFLGLSNGFQVPNKQALGLGLGSASDSTSSGSAFIPPWYIPTTLIQDLSSSWFQNEMELYLNATVLSYIATHGSYFNPAAVNWTINPQWRKDHRLSANPINGGMHALVFENIADGRILVVFRGTDLGPDTASRDADVCADAILFGGATARSQLPPFCANYTDSTLDYLTSARHLVNNVLAAYPKGSIMLTGHSLGAGLAQLVAAVSDSCITSTSPMGTTLGQSIAGAIVFSAPGYIETILRRSNVSLVSIDLSYFVVFADVWDPVYVASKASPLGGFLGFSCEWTVGNESQACKTCNANPKNISLTNPVCDICMDQRHDLKHYDMLIKSGAQHGLVCKTLPRHPCVQDSSSDPGPGSETSDSGYSCENSVSYGCLRWLA